MKKAILCIFMLFSCSLIAQNIYNNSFEDWTFGGLIQKPTGWSTSNEFTSLQSIYTVEPDSIAFDGMYAVHIKTIDIGNPAVPYPGFVVNGNMLPTGSNDFEKIGFAGEAFPHKPYKLRAYYKFKSNSSIEDWAYASVLLKKYDSSGHTSINIGFGSNSNLIPTDHFTYFEVPINYMVKNEVPDSIVVAFFSSYPQSPISGGELWVDKISFDYTISTREEQNNFKLYPNPVINHLYIENSKQTNLQYALYTLLGEKVVEGDLDNEMNKIDMQSFSKGLFLLHLYSASGRSVYPILKIE
jgi:hypothetical protein